MEGFFVVLGVIIMFGPIVWALTVGRNGGAPDNEDAAGATAYGSFIRRILSGGRRG